MAYEDEQRRKSSASLVCSAMKLVAFSFLLFFLLVKFEFRVFIWGSNVMEVLEASGGDFKFRLDEFRSFFFFKGVMRPFNYFLLLFC